MGHTALVLALYLFSVMRIVRLITADTILDRFRIAIARMARDDDRTANNRALWAVVSEFLGCPWCVGMWVAMGAGVVPVMLLGWPWWTVLPLGLSCSQLVGMAAPLYNDDEIEFEPVQTN